MLKHILLDAESRRCSECIGGHLCLPGPSMSAAEVKLFDPLLKERLRIPKGQPLFKIGDPLNSIYSLRSGFIKTQLESENGHIQIIGFFLPSELIGMDGMADKHHQSTAIALEDSEVCVLNLHELEQYAQQLPALQTQLRNILSNEISRSNRLILTLGALRSEQRVAAFLLDLSHRYEQLGYSPNEFFLRMSREDIGNYLGLTLETVSRLLSRFSREGIIKVQQREVQILCKSKLYELLGYSAK